MIELLYRGLVDYETALSEQIKIADGVRAGMHAPCVLAFEHPVVITMGKRSQGFNDLLASMDELRKRQIKIIATDRGGEATLHNPGQLVLYPILPLRAWHLGVRNYVECLERATAIFLAERGMDVTRGIEPGLFVNDKKIAAFGIRVDRGVSMHGLAINISNDLSVFNLIKQCGQITQATNLETEMKTFVEGDLPAWELLFEAQSWVELFRSELVALQN